MEQRRLLWELQEVEQEKNKKEQDLQKIPSVLQYREKFKKVDLAEKKLQQKGEELSAERKAQRLKEMDVAKISTLLEEFNSKLYNGKIGNAKELESMEKKVSSLGKDKELREDEIIVHMETIENLESEINHLQKQLKEEKEMLQKLKMHARRDRQSVQDELEKLSRYGEELAGKIDEGLLKKYRELSKRLGGGRCVSLVQNGFCGICNVSLPSSFIARLRTPGQLVYCENCSSLLIPEE